MYFTLSLSLLLSLSLSLSLSSFRVALVLNRHVATAETVTRVDELGSIVALI